ncbi:polysaccharide pyruvyl transferase family protein [Castellaniella sp. WN]
MSIFRFVITGVTLSGNMGGAAMLSAALQQLRHRYPSAHFQLLSIYPDADRAIGGDADLEIIDARPLRLLAWYMPLTLLAGLSEWLRRSMAQHSLFFHAIAEADAVIDLSGIAFVDKRGLSLLWYNMSCALPGIIWGKPVFKLSQALGPFHTNANRLAARLLLPRCAAVIARGEQSRQFLEELGIRDAEVLPDVSFAMIIPPEIEAEAQACLRDLGAQERPWIVVSPSRVVSRLCQKRGINFLGQMAAFIETLLGRYDANVLILPHSLGTGASKNNDIDLCQQLHARLHGHAQVYMHVPRQDPMLLRALIGQADFFIGCRFHAVVAALIMCVPTLILGWSHKYREMAQGFDANIPSMDFANFFEDALTDMFDSAWQRRVATRKRLVNNGSAIKAAAIRNFDIVERQLGASHARH